MVCPDRFCMEACSRKRFDGLDVNIPLIQASLVAEARRLGGIPAFAASQGRREEDRRSWEVAPQAWAQPRPRAGGFEVEIFEARDRLGGMCNLIPEHRLSKEMLAADLEFFLVARSDPRSNRREGRRSEVTAWQRLHGSACRRRTVGNDSARNPSREARDDDGGLPANPPKVTP